MGLLPVKWRNVLTERQLILGLEREIEEALYCPQCLPACSDVLYGVSMSALPIDNYLATLKMDENNQTEFSTDISVLRVFFADAHAQYYIRLLNNAWFEVFSKLWALSLPRILVYNTSICRYYWQHNVHLCRLLYGGHF